MKHIFSTLLLFPLLLFKLSLSGQEQVDYKNAPAFDTLSCITIAYGQTYTALRDFATSPLWFTGYPGSVSIGHVYESAQRQSNIQFNFVFGNLSKLYNGSFSEGSLQRFMVDYRELFQINLGNNPRWNYQLGASINATANYRVNGAFQNNREGFDMVGTLFLSGKIGWDLSRLQPKNKKLFWFEYTARRRTQNLDVLGHIGLINSSYRNGYAYTSPSAVLNEDEFFKNYEFRLLGGYRFSTAINFTYQLHNKNALRFSYLWDAYHSHNGNEALEMTVHTLQLALLFNVKK